MARSILFIAGMACIVAGLIMTVSYSNLWGLMLVGLGIAYVVATQLKKRNKLLYH